MSIERSLPPCTSRCYRITIEGKIDPSWSDWLGGMQLVSRKEADDMTITTLSGVLIDQSALRGLLNRLWDLSLIVLSVEQLNPTLKSNKE
ncbi:MAG: hypothetical protein JXB85_17850 [Anaerolineales bacterium]|nr:hypothetical protein [Anaerolineales bacterium]